MVALYVTSLEKGSGKTTICAGLGKHLLDDGKKIGFFKPVIADSKNPPMEGTDSDAAFIKRLFALKEPVDLLCPVLSDYGYNDVAYRLLLNDTFPSWGYSIKHGATTIWERWDGWTEEKGFQDPGMNSFNHYSFGSIVEWMFRYAAGIDLDPEVPGYKRFTIHPRPDSRLDHVRAVYASIHGNIASEWQWKGDAFTLNVTIPTNTTAKVYVPADAGTEITELGKPLDKVTGVELLQNDNGNVILSAGSGSYRFESTLSRGKQ